MVRRSTAACSGLGAFGLLSQLITVWQTRAAPRNPTRTTKHHRDFTAADSHRTGQCPSAAAGFLWRAPLIDRSAQQPHCPQVSCFDHTLSCSTRPIRWLWSIRSAIGSADPEAGDAIRLLSVVQRGSLLVTRTDEKTSGTRAQRRIPFTIRSVVCFGVRLAHVRGSASDAFNMTATVLSISPQGIPTRVAFRF